MLISGRTVSKVEKQKLQHYVPAGLVRALDIEIRKSKDPTLQTMSDGVTYCLEVGVAKLAEVNQSPEGLYLVELFGKVRRKEFEEKVKAAEFEILGFTPKDYGLIGSVSPIRRVVDEG